MIRLTQVLGGGLILKRQIITASGDWNRPVKMAGNTVWLTMIGGGASSRYIAPNGNGGWGGQFAIQLPVDIGSTSVVSCTIGVGGTAPASGAAMNAGSPTSFGAFASVNGGVIGGDGAPGGFGQSGAGFSDGRSTPLGYGGIVIAASTGNAGGGGGLILDFSGVSGGNDPTRTTKATGYGAGGASASIAPFTYAGARGAILVEWMEAI